MKLSFQEQKELDILIKELRYKKEAMQEGAFMISPNVAELLSIVTDIILLLEKRLN
jgi:N-acetylglutamate synthase/N-acetylornithine aminotransferase